MMKVFVAARSYVQGVPGSGEGLPYWMFWLLLCVILLLLAFIFLRDKDLRRRMSLFLSGAQRRMLRLRLHAKLRREKEKKKSLWKELGKKAWSEDIVAECVSSQCEKLATFEEEMRLQQNAWNEIFAKVEVLSREHEESSLRFRALIKEQEEARKPHEEERKSLSGRKSEILDAIGGAAWEIDAAEAQLRAVDKEVRAIDENAKIPKGEKAARIIKAQEKAAALAERIAGLQKNLPLLHEERRGLEERQADCESRIGVFNGRIGEIEQELGEENRVHDREFREWMRKKQRAQDKIVELQRLMEPLYESMGLKLDEARVELDSLAVIYFQIDAVNQNIRDLEGRIERLQ
jgi:predicted  nucleic acid-binding Zn-ribbon protein